MWKCMRSIDAQQKEKKLNGGFMVFLHTKNKT